MIRNQASYIFSKLESAGWRSGFFFRGLVGSGNIILENENLTKKNLGLLSRLADYENLESENEFLRKVLNISPRLRNEIAYANIYQFQLGLDGYDVLLNKGVSDGITEGDVIITEEGVLVGHIEKAYTDFSRVLAISDTDFSVTAEILNSDIVGIARGALGQGLYFDLIVQSDSIKEGDIVVSSGMDLIPPALIVGTVSYVETKDTDLFKKVKIKPAMGEVRIGRVLIIRNDQ
jgi:rod shape-determining protein MreC